MTRDPEQKSHQKEVGGQDARQGEIILRHGWSKAIFIAGLVAFVIVAFLMAGCIPPA